MLTVLKPEKEAKTCKGNGIWNIAVAIHAVFRKWVILKFECHLLQKTEKEIIAVREIES